MSQKDSAREQAQSEIHEAHVGDLPSSDLNPIDARTAAKPAETQLPLPSVDGAGGNPPPPSSSVATGVVADPFDPANLRLSQDFGATLGIKKALITVPVRKPAKEWYVRTHSDDAYRINTCVIELKEDRETYLVAQPLWPELASESTFGPRALFTSINRQGVIFLWSVRLPGPDGKIDSWNESAMEAALMARDQWVRVAANMALGANDVFTATAPLPPPVWPQVSLQELLRTAFKGRYIDSVEHLVIRKLRGEA